MEQGGGRDGVLWALVGCAGLLLVVLCVASGVGVYLVAERGLPALPSPRRAEPSTPGTPPPTDDPGGKPPVPAAPPVPAPAPDKPPPGGSGAIDLAVRVTEVTGSLGGRVLSSCEVHVEPPEPGSPNCHALVRCEGLVLYGERGTGYFPCSIDLAGASVTGRDGATQSSDGDAAFTVDTAARVLRVEDDAGSPLGAYTLEGTF